MGCSRLSKRKGCEEILVPTVGGPWEKYEEIDWDKLPDSFVIKATHGCKMNFFVKDKNKVDKDKCRSEINRWLNTTYGTYSIEPHYIPIPHRFYAEKYLGDISGLIDYKFHCIDGEPLFVIAFTDRKPHGDKAMEVTINLMDMEWNPIYEVTGYGNEKPGTGKLEKPTHFKEMVEYARILSKDFKFVRVDMYDRENGVLFGELTFSPAACVFPYLSENFLYEMGSKLSI